MYWDNIAFDIVLLGLTYLAWKRYQAEFFRWLFWVGMILAGASAWQYLIENTFPVPEYVRMGSLIAVQILRLVFIAAFALVGIRAVRTKPLSSSTEN
ncbi:MAG: hypothetical protein ACRD5H_13210, partial [Nitrososphaerales archaeon]